MWKRQRCLGIILGSSVKTPWSGSQRLPPEVNNPQVENHCPIDCPKVCAMKPCCLLWNGPSCLEMLQKCSDVILMGSSFIGSCYMLPPLAWTNRFILGPKLLTHFAVPCCCTRAQSCPSLCDPIDCSPPGSSIHGILQTRVLEWVAMPSSRGSSQLRDGTCISCITG